MTRTTGLALAGLTVAILGVPAALRLDTAVAWAAGPPSPPASGAQGRAGSSRPSRPEPGSAEAVRERYDAFKSGRRMWGHGVGRKVALTFDDGPHYQTTPRLLDHLDAFGVKATFFVNGQRFHRNGLITAKSRAVLLEAHRRGHLIGNHTHSHKLLPGSPAEQQRREIESTDRDIAEILGTPSYLFRPPFGAMSPYAAGLLKKRGSVVVMWNLGSDDDKNFNVAKVVNTLMRKLDRQGGGIVLMHDTHYWTIEAVPFLLEAIRIESCRLLAEGEEPYEIVGLEHFFQPRGGAPRTRGAEVERAWRRRRAALGRRCNRGPTGPLPEFLRGETP